MPARRCAARRVAFTTATFHYFPMGLSDNPSVRSGVALGLNGPEAESCRRTLSVDEHQPLVARPRRPAPWLHPERRREILADEGVSPEAIEACKVELRAAQLDRIRSLPPLQKLEKLPWFVARSLRRKLRRSLSRSSFGSSSNLAALDADAPPPKERHTGLGSAEAQAAVADAGDAADTASPEGARLARRLDGLAVSRKPAPPAPTDAMDGSLSGLAPAFADLRAPRPLEGGAPTATEAMDGSLSGLAPALPPGRLSSSPPGAPDGSLLRGFASSSPPGALDGSLRGYSAAMDGSLYGMDASLYGGRPRK